MALPTRGQRDWDDELNNEIQRLDSDVQSAVANASSAKSTAISAQTSADAAAASAAQSATAAKTAANAAYGVRRSVHAATYLTSGATAAENTTALNLAIADAAAAGFDVCFDGVDAQIDAELDIVTAGLRLWSSTPAACRITQTTMGEGVFFAYADNVTIDGFTLVGTLADTGTSVDFGGYSGDPHLAAAIKIDRGVEGLAIKRIVASNWFCGLAGFPYPFTARDTPAAEYQNIVGLSVEDFAVESVWAAVRMSGLENASFRNVRGSYKPAINHTGSPDANTAPPHLFYITQMTDSTETPVAYNIDVRIRDCHGQDGVGGAPFSLRYIKGLTWSNLTADNCEGLVDMIGVVGFHGSGGHATRDKYPRDNTWNGNRGSLAMLYCADGVIDPCVIEGADDFDHGSLFYVGACDRVTVIEPRGWFDQTVALDRAVYFSGRDSRMVRPDIESRGVAAHVGISLAEGSSKDSTVTVDDPSVRGAFLRAVEFVPTTTGRRTLIYDPDSLEATSHKVSLLDGITAADAPRLINTRYGYPPNEDARVIGWHTGEKVSYNGIFRTRWPSGHPSSVVTDAWVSNPPYINANATVTGLLCADFGVADVDITCKVKYGTGATQVGVTARAVDASNFLALFINNTSVVLAKRVADVETGLASIALDVATPGIWHELRMRVVGSRVLGYLNGVEVIDHTLTGGDEVTFASATSHGLRSDAGGASSAWYDFRIRAA